MEVRAPNSFVGASLVDVSLVSGSFVDGSLGVEEDGVVVGVVPESGAIVPDVARVVEVVAVVDGDTVVEEDGAGEDTDSDRVHNLCDAFPTDPDRSGPTLFQGLVGVDDQWQTLDLSGTYQDLVVIAGASTGNDADPGVVQVDNVNAVALTVGMHDVHTISGDLNNFCVALNLVFADDSKVTL